MHFLWSKASVKFLNDDSSSHFSAVLQANDLSESGHLHLYSLINFSL